MTSYKEREILYKRICTLAKLQTRLTIYSVQEMSNGLHVDLMQHCRDIPLW